MSNFIQLDSISISNSIQLNFSENDFLYRILITTVNENSNEEHLCVGNSVETTVVRMNEHYTAKFLQN